jgi:hypothetical protein
MSIVLRAQITIDVRAEDFIGAAEHQRRLEELMGQIRELYSDADLSFRERRTRPARSLPRRRVVRQYADTVAEYGDA